MPTIGLLEGFQPSRMRVRPSVMLGRDYDLVRASPPRSLRRSQVNYLRGDGMTYVRETRPAGFVESKDETGRVVSVVQTLPAIYTIAPNIPMRQTLIDDYQGQYPQGNRGGSGSVPGASSYKDEPEKEDPMTPIDTRGNSVAAYGEGAASPTGKSGIALPLLAIAAYYLFK